MSRYLHLFIGLSILLAAAACAGVPNSPLPAISTPTQPEPQQPSVTNPPPTETLSPTPTSAPVIPMPTPNPVSASMAELSGMVIGGDELSVVNPDGSLRSLITRPVTNVSPDMQWAVTENNGDLWLYRLSTQNLLRLTMTDNLEEHLSAWWPMHPDDLLFLSRAKDELATQEYLATIHTNGTNYRILDKDHPAQDRPVPSPDGVWVAYGGGEQAWLWGGESGPQVINPTDFGLTSLKGQEIFDPAWSPDGQKLAYTWKSVLNVGERMGIVIFDLEKKSYQLTHLYTPVAGTKFGINPLWSPDGKWLAYVTITDDPAEQGTWLIRTDGSGEEIHITGNGFRPVAWKPDGTRLALMQAEVGKFALWLLTPDSWDLRRVEMQITPYNQIIAWK